VAGSKRAFENRVPDSNARKSIAMRESRIAKVAFQHPLNSPDRNLQQVIGACDKWGDFDALIEKREKALGPWLFRAATCEAHHRRRTIFFFCIDEVLKVGRQA
jgi:hypothetical protein